MKDDVGRMLSMRELFGSSSDDDDDDADDDGSLTPARKVERQKPCATATAVFFSSAIPGLSLVRSFLNEAQQNVFRKHLEAELGPSNQAMRFGALPLWAEHLADLVQAAATMHGLLPPHVASRTPLYNQMIVNLYRPGEGIRHHVDLMRFEDGICSVSFGDPVVMSFTPTAGEQAGCEHQVLLQGGDLLMLHSGARYDWQHGIAAVAEEWYMEARAPWAQQPDAWRGQAASGGGPQAGCGGGGPQIGGPQAGPQAGGAVGACGGTSRGLQVVRGTRLSVTLRRMCSGIVLSESASSAGLPQDQVH